MPKFYHRFTSPPNALSRAAGVILGVSGLSYCTHALSDPACPQYLSSRGRYVLDHLLGLKFQTIYAESPQDSGLWRNLVMIKGETSRRKESGIALYSFLIAQRSDIPRLHHFYLNENWVDPGRRWDRNVFTQYSAHPGPALAAYLAEYLPKMVLTYLDKFETHQDYHHNNLSNERFGSIWGTQLTPATYDYALRHVFRTQERLIAGHAGPNQTEPWRPGVESGAHVLMSIYDAHTRLLRVASLGTARAVLGRRTKAAGGKTVYEVHALSIDQDAQNPHEAASLAARHPGESLIENGRVFGRRSTRCFGDMPFKWSRKTTAALHQQYPTVVNAPPDDVLTPPYFTVDPEITTTSIQPGDFLIMGSEALWDLLSNEEAIGLVGIWLEKNSSHVWGGAEKALEYGYSATAVVQRCDEHPIPLDELPVSFGEPTTESRTTKQFVNTDGNVALHLSRNALGGADSSVLTSTEASSAPLRDGLAVQVVFFS